MAEEGCPILDCWDTASKIQKKQFLTEFVSQYGEDRDFIPEIVFGSNASLLLYRITSWIKLTCPLGIISPIQLRALAVLIKTSSSRGFIDEFIEVGGLKYIFDAFNTATGFSIHDKCEIIRMWSKIGRLSLKNKKLICDDGQLMLISKTLSIIEDEVIWLSFRAFYLDICVSSLGCTNELMSTMELFFLSYDNEVAQIFVAQVAIELLSPESVFSSPQYKEFYNEYFVPLSIKSLFSTNIVVRHHNLQLVCVLIKEDSSQKQLISIFAEWFKECVKNNGVEQFFSKELQNLQSSIVWACKCIRRVYRRMPNLVQYMAQSSIFISLFSIILINDHSELHKQAASSTILKLARENVAIEKLAQISHNPIVYVDNLYKDLKGERFGLKFINALLSNELKRNLMKAQMKEIGLYGKLENCENVGIEIENVIEDPILASIECELLEQFGTSVELNEEELVFVGKKSSERQKKVITRRRSSIMYKHSSLDEIINSSL